MLENIAEIENSLWEAADQLRANSKLTATEYSMPVLGLIFLRFAYNRFVIIKDKIEQNLVSYPGRGKRKITKDDYLSEKAIYLPEKSRFDYLVDLPESANIGEAINEAMKFIEEEYPNLAGVLPKTYNDFENNLLYGLLRILDHEAIRQIQGDAFGKIYEYFLNQFAISGAQEGGEFFTPLSLVSTIVNIIQPDHGIVLDPACGSAGMFVQTGHFIESQGADPVAKITIYGQEKTTTNTRLAKMNLAVHGLEGNIVEKNTFYNDEFNLAGKCDFVMANPPFNVDGVDKKKDFVKNDPRLLYVNDENGNKVRLVPNSDNANYLWIQYFYGYLNETGRAGFVMASSASDAGHSEKEIRTKLVNTGAVDVMISVGTNFFYSVTLPCTLWFFDRSKENDEIYKNKTLMLDARNIYRVVTRKINDFSPEQLSNITAIVELYRENNNYFIDLVTDYINKSINYFNNIGTNYNNLIYVLNPLYNQLNTYIQQNNIFTDEFNNINYDAVKNNYEQFDKLRKINCANEIYTAKDNSLNNKKQHNKYNLLTKLAENAKILRTSIEHTIKEMFFLVEQIQVKYKENGEKNNIPQEWKQSEIRKKTNDIELNKNALFETIKSAKYFINEIKWLQTRFPDAVYTDVLGLCKVVSREEIADNDFSLTPGRYVGVTPAIEDNYDFAERLKEIHLELENLNNEAAELAKTISANFLDLGL